MAEDFEIPEDLYYTEEHEWVKVEDSLVRIGITDFAQDQLGDIIFVEFPETGQEVEQVVKEGGEEAEIGAIESVKSVSSIYSPISGKVKEVNEDLEDDPELINSDPYGEGWYCVVEPSDIEGELDNLMDAEAYKEFLESQE